MLEQIAHVVPCADSLLSVKRALALAVSDEHVGPSLERELTDDREIFPPAQEGRDEPGQYFCELAPRLLARLATVARPRSILGGRTGRGELAHLTASWRRVVPVLSSSAFKSRIAALGDLRILRISADALDVLSGAVEVEVRALWPNEAIDGVERRVEVAPCAGELMYADSWARKWFCRLARDSDG